METSARIKALDLFAGTGWGVACQRLGIKEAGVEIMPEACATREANGMETIYHDVWDGLQLTAEEHRHRYGSYQLLIASPPCQTFSMAGSGAGRQAMNEVLEAIETHAYKSAAALREFGERHDPRTALVLTPLAYVWRDRPRLVALEQVPTVLPVWEACAEVLRGLGYEVKVEVLNAEQYGVPQTRRRAILVARRGGPVHLPIPTHSRYYTRTPDKLDPGVQKWVSMAEALGWGMTERPYLTVTGGGDSDTSKHTGGVAPSALGSATARQRVATEMEQGRFVFPDEPGRQLTTPGGELKMEVEEIATLQSYPHALRSNYGTGGDPANRGERTPDQPAPTITGKADRNKWDGEENMTEEQASALQSYPAGWGFTNRPALTLTGHGFLTRQPTGQQQAVMKAVDAGEFAFKPPFTPDTAEKPEGDHSSLKTRFHPDAVNFSVEEAVALQSYPSEFRSGHRPNASVRPVDHPAPTIIAGNDTKNRGWVDDSERGVRPASIPEVAALQTYERPFVWCGNKSKKFLQIGNAVPPLLAEHVLAALVGIVPGR